MRSSNVVVIGFSLSRSVSIVVLSVTTSCTGYFRRKGFWNDIGDKDSRLF